MSITIRANLHYEATQPCELLLQIEAAVQKSQRCVHSKLTLTPDPGSHLIDGHDGLGTRRWIKETKTFVCLYEAVFEVDRVQEPIANLPSQKVSQTPTLVTQYLLPSRYCHPEVFFEFLAQYFSTLSGGALIVALCEWIAENLEYDMNASTATTTAAESFGKRAGVCRDYAHLLISMARAAGIPARYVSAYAPDVHPQDFHAVVEVFLDGAWCLVDPTGMSQPCNIVRIGVGRDAADVSFLTSYGLIAIINQTVEVSRTFAVKAEP